MIFVWKDGRRDEGSSDVSKLRAQADRTGQTRSLESGTDPGETKKAHLVDAPSVVR